MHELLGRIQQSADSSKRADLVPSESAPPIPPEFLKRRFDKRVRHALIISCVIVLPALGARMAYVSQELPHPEREWSYVILIAEALAMLVTTAGFYFRRIALSMVQMLSSLLALFLILGACLGVVFYQENWPNVGGVIVLIGAASVLLSWRWFLVMALAGAAGMLASAATIQTPWEWLHGLFWMGFFLAIAAASHAGRMVLYRRIETLRWKDDWARSQLHHLIEQLQHEVEERRAVQRELVRKEEESRQLAHRILTVQERERGRISRELHDQLGQILSAISLQIRGARRLASPELAGRLDESAQAVREAIDEVRRLSTELRPSLLDDLGLESALRWSVDRQSSRADLRIDFESENGHGRFPLEVEAACFRIAQEALTNSVRHSGATRVRVHYANDGHCLTVGVVDDGVGFDVDEVRTRPMERRGLGLLGMRERAEALGGRLAIQSSLGQGTAVEVEFVRPAMDEVAAS